ncbi:hypothetical protein H634G_00654 [Metarhizium anisopliae BRIP 53293]|uniref:Uncharacterized protein n=1 Tax=Metarhizium anisopliae BRIP 53293 TaxID=1291518 RepID=A0A0D9PHI7_METAN|nr:hypothetical protein H634G_00654 [Metarhizium anisopliae BRIP 53293]KJK94494.1 hypothetical protein H633G_01577 [Metarhizium anisopliae BRIP 53284]
MKFFAVTLLALATAVMAAPSVKERDIFIRQEFVVDTETPSMTDAQGNVVPFDAANVNLANTNAGF